MTVTSLGRARSTRTAPLGRSRPTTASGSANSASAGGGVFQNTTLAFDEGSLDVVRSTFDGNVATGGWGGAIAVNTDDGLPPVTVDTSTLSGNKFTFADGQTHEAHDFGLFANVSIGWRF